MTEKVSGAIKQINRWEKGQGANVIFDDSDSEYFYRGDIGLEKFIGQSGTFEVIDGEGDQKGKYEILNFTPFKTNPEISKPKIPKELLEQQAQQRAKSFVQIPYDQFQKVMSMKGSLQESRTRALTAAVEVYKAMSKVERDPKAAAGDTVTIARILEGYLL